MYCMYCRLKRPEDENACPNCGAPSLLTPEGEGSQAQLVEIERRSSGALSAPPRTDALQGAQRAFPTQAYGSYAPSTSPLEGERQQTLALQLVPEHALADLLPTQTGKHAFVAIPPMYTKPRPATPVRRIIGGFLSVLIVCGLLCAGSAYLVQNSPLFAKVSRIYSDARPKNVPPTVWAKLPDAPEQSDKDRNGPGMAVIPSATTAGRYDPKTYLALAPQTKFTTQQTIYLTFSVQTPKQDGKVVAKWYTNNRYFLTQQSELLKVKDVPAGAVKNGLFSMRYGIPAEGKVELYWNDQWAQTLYFVVNP